MQILLRGALILVAVLFLAPAGARAGSAAATPASPAYRHLAAWLPRGGWP